MTELADKFDDEDLREPVLPLEHLRLACACGKTDCNAVAAFGVANGRLKIGLNLPSDHFVADAEFVGQVAEQLVVEIEQAKRPPGDGGDV